MTLDKLDVAEITKHRTDEVSKCEVCGSTVDVSFDVSAYSEISGDETPVWQCANCRRDMAMDA